MQIGRRIFFVDRFNYRDYLDGGRVRRVFHDLEYLVKCRRIANTQAILKAGVEADPHIICALILIEAIVGFARRYIQPQRFGISPEARLDRFYCDLLCE